MVFFSMRAGRARAGGEVSPVDARHRSQAAARTPAAAGPRVAPLRVFYASDANPMVVEAVRPLVEEFRRDEVAVFPWWAVRWRQPKREEA